MAKKTKEPIPIENVRLLAETLRKIVNAIDVFVDECDETNTKHVILDGWPTMGKGVGHILDQTKKFMGQGGLIGSIHQREFLMEQHKVLETSVPRKPKSSKQAKSVKQIEKETKTRRLKLKSERNDDSE